MFNNHPRIQVFPAHENSTQMYKIKLDGEVICIKKLFANDSLEKIRVSLQAD